MHIRRTDADTIEIAALDSLCSDFLRQIVPCAQCDDHPAVQARLYSSPSEGREPDFDQDWKSYVEPDLRDLFRSAREIVEADLQNLTPVASPDDATLRIPFKHLEAWIHVLNQARLALSALHDFTERDMESALGMSDDRRSIALFQVHLYGFLQECFLRILDS